MKKLNSPLVFCISLVWALLLLSQSAEATDRLVANKSACFEVIASSEQWWNTLMEAHPQKMAAVGQWKEIRETGAYVELLHQMHNRLEKFAKNGRAAIFWEMIGIGDVGQTHRLGILVDGKNPILIWAYGYNGSEINEVTGKTKNERFELLQLFQRLSKFLVNGPAYCFSPIKYGKGEELGGWGYIRLVGMFSNGERQSLLGGKAGSREEGSEAMIVHIISAKKDGELEASHSDR